MIDACEIIAWHLCTMAAQEWSGISELDRAAYRTTAAGMVEAITDSGFRILGPDEIDGPTVEKCAEVAETCPDTPFAISRKWYGDLRQSIPAAIRALQEKRT
ncbi:hypothetical protein [Aquamicrobium zhengzhouense]|uniref:hypothetical protein n=1 Tax=Aquamicrobium zhengzhouense TaxID=2781738 RepID=UPI001AED60E8|nr:hypothetical protein [Aquamicrobium zhengzhouense]